MIANCVAVILPVALIRVWSAPMIAARLRWQDVLDLKGDGLGNRADTRMKSATVWRPVLRSIQAAPIIALDLEKEIGIEQGAISDGSRPLRSLPEASVQ